MKIDIVMNNASFEIDNWVVIWIMQQEMLANTSGRFVTEIMVCNEKMDCNKLI